MASILNPNGSAGRLIKPTPDNSRNTLSFDYPIFCFKHLHKKFHIDSCEKNEKVKLIERLSKLSTMTWTQIQHADRHGFGSEKISRESIKASIPPHITDDQDFYALRFDGLKAMVGYKSNYIFHIVYLDPKFILYKH